MGIIKTESTRKVGAPIEITMPTNLHEARVLQQRPRLQEACLKLQEIALQLGPDAKLPTTSELRSALGVSVHTLNNAVRELERRNVLRTVNGVGIYVASHQPRTLTGNIGFITDANLGLVQDIPYWGRLLAGVRSEVARSGRHLLLIDNMHSFREWEKIDGAILFLRLVSPPQGEKAGSGRPRPDSGFSIPKGLPAVAMLEPLANLPSVTIDDFQGTYSLVQRLIELGHRRIAYLAEADTNYAMLRERRRGYLAALKEAGLPCDERWQRELRVEGWNERADWLKHSGFTFMREWLAGDWAELGCTALVAQNDGVAMGAVMAFREAGLEVPADVSVTGFDATYSEFLPPLTTVEVPLFEVGQTAVQMIEAELEDDSHFPESRCLPLRLVAGESSCDAPELAASQY